MRPPTRREPRAPMAPRPGVESRTGLGRIRNPQAGGKGSGHLDPGLWRVGITTMVSDGRGAPDAGRRRTGKRSVIAGKRSGRRGDSGEGCRHSGRGRGATMIMKGPMV